MKKLTEKNQRLLGVLAALAAVGICGLLLYQSRFVTVNDRRIDLWSAELDLHGEKLEDLEFLTRMKQLQKLDIRDCGLSLSQHEWLLEQLPDCEIRWEIEFQGKIYSPETRELTLDHLSPEDLEVLDSFRQLQTVHGEACEDYEALTELARRHPDCEILYTVLLGGTDWALDTQDLLLKDETADHVRRGLSYLPQARSVEFSGRLPPMKELRALEQEFPDIAFSWLVTLGDTQVPGTAEQVDLAQVQDPQSFVDAVPYLPGLKTVNLRESALSMEQKGSLALSYPDLCFLWDIPLGENLVASDAQEAEITGELDSPEVLRQALPYFHGLKKLVVLDSGLSNEDLDALNQEFPDIRIAWNLMCGGNMIRTDDLYFAPNKEPFQDLRDETLEGLRYCPDMVCVDVGHGSMTRCDWAAYMPNLKYLIMADTPVNDLTPLKDLKQLVFLEIFQTPVRDYSPLLGCTALEDLNLCYSYGNADPIKEMTWLKRLWWSGSTAPAYQLREALPDTQVECSSLSSTGKGWREGQNYYDMRDFIGMWYMIG